MKKLIKSLSILVGVIIVLTLVSLVALTQFVDPNDYKEEITQLAENKTGRSLRIEGDIAWRFFPRLGLDISNVALGNAKGFDDKPFATLNHLNFQLNILALLRAEVRVDRIHVDGLALNLAINKSGETNWSDFTAPKQQAAFAYPTIQLVSHHNPTHQMLPVDLNIKQLYVHNTTVNMDNALAETALVIKDIRFSAKNLQLAEAFPITLNFNAHALPLDIHKKIDMRGQLRVDMSTGTLYAAPIQLNNLVTIPNQPPISIAMNTQASFNWVDGWAQFKSIKGKFNDADITGQVQAQDLFSEHPLVLGTLNAERLQWQKIMIDTLHTDIKSQNGTITLSPIDASLYQGTLKGELAANLIESGYQLSGQLDNIAVGSVLRDVVGVPNLSGDMQGRYYFTTTGQAPEEMKRNLQGQANVVIADGTLEGADLGYYLAKAKAMIAQKETSREDRQQTTFGSLTGQFKADEGIIHNPSLEMTSDKFNITGHGTYALLSNALNYTLQAKEADTSDSPLGDAPLGIRITGQPPELVYTPDFESLIQHLIEKQLKKQTNRILEKLGEDIGQDLGEGTDDAVERGLGETLKKLPFGDIFKKK